MSGGGGGGGGQRGGRRFKKKKNPKWELEKTMDFKELLSLLGWFVFYILSNLFFYVTVFG